jgi:hypothetical protein
MFGVEKGYELVDRQLKSPTTTVLDELRPNVHQGDAIILSRGDGTLNIVVSVRSTTPLFTYVEGIDYTVNLALGRIDILSGGGARIDLSGTGMDLYISYVLSKTPLDKFTRNLLSVSSDLSLFNSQLQFGASYSEEKLTLVRGTPSDSLQNSRIGIVYLGGNYDNFNYRLSYNDYALGSQSHRAIEGTGRFRWSHYNSVLTLSAHNIYTMYAANKTVAGYNENLAELAVMYQKNILSYMNLTLQANVRDFRSDVNLNRDSLSFKLKYLVYLNKIVIQLYGQTDWTILNSLKIRDDSLRINITRYF